MKKRTIYITLTAILLVCMQTTAYAALVSTINTDTANQLDITWFWDETAPSIDNPVLSNWNGVISLQFYHTSAPNEFIGSVGITEYLQNDPMAIFMTMILILPFDVDQYGILTDFNTSTPNANYHFLYVKDPNPAESVIHLTATTVPIPGAIILFGSGILGLFITKKTNKPKLLI